MNGIPAIKIENRSFYIGIAHAIVNYYKWNYERDQQLYIRNYTHFFYRMAIDPPFQILDISLPIPLQSDNSYAVWFKPHEPAHVNFVNGLEYLPRSNSGYHNNYIGGGGDLILSYGVGDRASYVTRLSVRDALSLFDPKHIKNTVIQSKLQEQEKSNRNKDVFTFNSNGISLQTPHNNREQNNSNITEIIHRNQNQTSQQSLTNITVSLHKFNHSNIAKNFNETDIVIINEIINEINYRKFIMYTSLVLLGLLIAFFNSPLAFRCCYN